MENEYNNPPENIGIETESNHPSLQVYKDRLALLEKEIVNAKDQNIELNRTYNNLRATYNTKKDELKDALVELVRDENLEIEHAQTLADIFGISLTKIVDVRLTLSALVQVEVPITADDDDVASNVYPDSVSWYSYDGEIIDDEISVEDYNVS